MMVDFSKKLMKQALDLGRTVHFTQRAGEWFAALGDELDSLSPEELEAYRAELTDQDGEINIPKLEPGVYSIKETATVADHILDLQEYHVELFPGQTSTVTIENQKRPNLIVYKKDADTGKPIPDTIFTVRAADGHSVDEIKTDANGRATLDNLLPGVYEISEKSVPAPWLMDAAPSL